MVTSMIINYKQHIDNFSQIWYLPHSLGPGWVFFYSRFISSEQQVVIQAWEPASQNQCSHAEFPKRCLPVLKVLWCLLLVGRFERAIADFGMNTGVIATGLILLRMVDPESRTPVPADFAFKQLLHSPFMGGGIWTCLALPLLNILK